LDALDARRAMALMRVLAEAGDSAGALAHSRTYETLVRFELDASADPTVIALASEIRARSERHSTTAAAPTPGLRTAPQTAPLGDAEPPNRIAEDDDATTSVPQTTARARLGRRRHALMYGLVALTLIAAPFVARRFTDDTPAVATTAVVPEPHATAAAPRHTSSVDAYEWYVRGMDLSLMRTTAGGQRALEYFERAIAADSNFAAAYAGLVRVYLGNVDDARGDQDAFFARAEQAALRAVALEPSLAEAHGALGWVRVGRLEWTAAEAEFRRAIALDPRAPRVYEGLARTYLWAGRPAEQLQAARVGLEIDPFSHAAIREMALALAANGRCGEALKLLQPLKALSPPAGVAGVIRGQCFAAKRMWPEAIAEFRWAAETTDARAALAFLGYALARSGRRDEARSILSDLLAGRRYSHGAFGIAVVYAGLGDRERAFGYLDRAVGEKTVRPYIMGPMFEDLRRDARFARFKARMGS
jgi:tetratricopeptide (TPR) repeat protein